MDRPSARIVHLTSVHPARDTRIYGKECRSLAEAGFEVVLIAPHGCEEVMDGVRVRPVAMAASRWARVTRTVRAVYRAAIQENGDLYHFHDPELIPVGLALKRRGKRVVYDIHEDVPRNVLSKYWIPRPVRRPLSAAVEALERYAVRRFDAAVAATPPIAARFESKPSDAVGNAGNMRPPARSAGAPRVATVMNFPRLEETRLAEPVPYAARPSEIAYVGSLSAIRGASEMVEAMSLLPAGPEARLRIAGLFYPPELVASLGERPGWDRVEVLGWCDRPRIAEVLGRARAGLVTLHPTESFRESYPIKLFEYMSFGVPVIASDFPLWREIVDGAGAGLLVDPLRPAAIAEAIHWLLEHPAEAEEMGRRGREAVRERYGWRSQAEILLSLYADLLEPA